MNFNSSKELIRCMQQLHDTSILHNLCKQRTSQQIPQSACVHRFGYVYLFLTQIQVHLTLCNDRSDHEHDSHAVIYTLRLETMHILILAKMYQAFEGHRKEILYLNETERIFTQ